MGKYSALIIGAGLIASDFDTPNNDAVLTHAHAYKNNPDTELLGFYDIDFSRAQKAAEKWGVNAYKELTNADIISICVPDEFHTKMVLEAKKLNPKIIFLEKPVCRDLSDTEILKNVDIPILVNYSRSFSKSFQDLKKRILSGEFGQYKSGVGYYGKGFIHNGSHMVNLLNLLFGDISDVEFKNEINDFYNDDHSKFATLNFKNGGYFIMNPVDCRDYTIFEFDFIFEKARVRVLNSGYQIEIYKSAESKKFKGYQMLELSEKIDTDLDFAMKNAVQNIVDFLDGKETLLCDLQKGIVAIKFTQSNYTC
ncbi:Gfo/Idh/MocA family oxidoreductase [bacterium]|nr:Gfo/Idh/MocA family oxidoreductase [bacterium]